MAAWFPDIFFNFFVKNHKIYNNSATTEVRDKISTSLESIEYKEKFDACLTKFRNNQILINKISISNDRQDIYKEKHSHSHQSTFNLPITAF